MIFFRELFRNPQRDQLTDSILKEVLPQIGNRPVTELESLINRRLKEQGIVVVYDYRGTEPEFNSGYSGPKSPTETGGDMLNR